MPSASTKATVTAWPSSCAFKTGIGISASSDCECSSSTDAFHVPSTEKTIPPFAFASCFALHSVTGMENVARVGAYAFAWSGLSKLDWPNFTDAVPEAAFLDCSTLLSVNGLEAVTSVGPRAFDGAHQIVLPTSAHEFNSVLRAHEAPSDPPGKDLSGGQVAVLVFLAAFVCGALILAIYFLCRCASSVKSTEAAGASGNTAVSKGTAASAATEQTPLQQKQVRTKDGWVLEPRPIPAPASGGPLSDEDEIAF